MATKTTNYNLTKPSYNESADISVINQNMDIIDEKMKEIENASGGGGTSVTVDRELSTTSENPVQNKVITQELNDKGTYSKPTGGIPKTDLANEVQTSLGKADTALQEHQDISGKADKTEVTAIFNSISDAWNSANAYTVGQYCIYNNALWKCLVANTNTEPAEGTYWTQTTIDAEISAVNSNLNAKKLLTVTSGSSNFTIISYYAYKQGDHIHAEVYGNVSETITNATSYPFFCLSDSHIPFSETKCGAVYIDELVFPSCAHIDTSNKYFRQIATNTINANTHIGFIIDFVI